MVVSTVVVVVFTLNCSPISKSPLGIVVPMPTPEEFTTALIVPAVVKLKVSSSLPAVVSAVMNVSPSTSLTPPREPH